MCFAFEDCYYRSGLIAQALLGLKTRHFAQSVDLASTNERAPLLFLWRLGFRFYQGSILLVWPLRGRIEEERQRSHTLFHSPLVVVPKRRDVASSHLRLANGSVLSHTSLFPFSLLLTLCASHLGLAAFTQALLCRERAAQCRLARLERFVDVQLTSLLLVVISKR